MQIPCIYADDTTLKYTHCFIINKLSLNVGKTKYTVFHTKQKKIK